MNPIKLKIGSIPKGSQTAITPVPGSPPPLQQEQPTRPNAVGAQATVKSPKAKTKNLDGMVKSDAPKKGTLKLQSFLNGRSQKVNKK